MRNSIFVFMTRLCWRHADGLRSRIIGFYLLFGLANIVISLQPVALARLIDTAQLGGEGAIGRALGWVLVYAGLTLVFWALHGPARVIERRVAFAVYQDFVASLYRKVTLMPLRWHQDHHSGGLINRANKAGKALFTFGQSQFVILQTVMRLVASLTVLAWYAWWVALASVVSTALILRLVQRYDRRLIPLERTTNEYEHRLNAALYDYIGNIVTVLTLRLQGNTGDEIMRRFGAMKPSFWRETVVNEQKWFVMQALLVFVQTGIVGAYVLIHLARDGALQIGPVVAIFQYLLTINQLFAQGALSYEQLLHQHTDMQGIKGLLEDYDRLAPAQALPPPTPAWSRIAIDDLNFTHREGEDILHHLRHVNLSMAAGQKIALIGSSGSGKTTLLTLLRGLYAAHSVTLTIDDAAHGSLAPLAGFTTLIPQDAEIFENTVGYNLTLGTEVAPELVAQALAVSTFADVVPKLPEGLATDIRERGVNLSGGQKQRLAFARGLIAARDSSLLLMDEPTSSVDLATEGLIFDRLFVALAGKAIIASVHRLHLLPRFDRIGLMRDGQLLEFGSFADLLAQDGAFAALWQHHLDQTAGADRRVRAGRREDER